MGTDAVKCGMERLVDVDTMKQGMRKLLMWIP